MTVPVCPWPTEPCISGTLVTLACELPATHPACQKPRTMVGHLQTAHAPLGKHRHSLSLVRCDPPPSQSARSCNITIQLLQFHCNSDETCVFQQFFTIISLFPNNLHVRHLYGFFNHILYIVFSDCWTIQLVIKEFKWSARVCGAAAILQLRL